MEPDIRNAWQGDYAEQWLRAEANKNRQLEPFGALALAALSARPGEWILDVGCGTGATSLELARITAPSGGVCGIDVSGAMLARARENSAATGLRNLEWICADAATHAFTRRYDRLFSRLGVMFFEDPRAAFENLGRALVPGAHVAFVCWQSLADNPWVEVPLRAVRSVAPSAPLPAMLVPHKPGPFFFGERSRIEGALNGAGFREVAVQPHTRPAWLGTTLEESVQYCLDTGPSGRFVSTLPKELEPDCRRALHGALAPHATPNGTYLEGAVYVVTARLA